jgi:hypothetical protein
MWERFGVRGPVLHGGVLLAEGVLLVLAPELAETRSDLGDLVFGLFEHRLGVLELL